MTVREKSDFKATEEARFSYGHGALLKNKAITKFALEMKEKMISAALPLSRRFETYPEETSRKLYLQEKWRMNRNF